MSSTFNQRSSSVFNDAKSINDDNQSYNQDSQSALSVSRSIQNPQQSQQFGREQFSNQSFQTFQNMERGYQIQEQQTQQNFQQQNEIQMQKDMKIQEGDQSIQRAQQLISQIEKQVHKRGIGDENDENQKEYQRLIRKKREYEEEYLKKTKEFYLTEGMNIDKMQDFIVENFELNLQQQRAKMDQEIKEKEEMLQQQFSQNRRLFEQRMPQLSNIRTNYYKSQKDIFKPLKQIEIKQFYQQMKEKQKTIDVSEYMEKRAFDQLEESYYKTYYEWLVNQPQVEDQRAYLQELFVECFELNSTLNNQPESFDKPLIWHTLAFTENEKKYVDEWMRKKNLIKNNKYGFLEDDQEFEADELLKKTEKFFETDLFLQQDYNDEQYSDDEKGNLKKYLEKKEPYNEDTLYNYDNEIKELDDIPDKQD